jgi:LacI family transcriptional regulator
MPVTIKEIARKTGLSIPTVGNVLGRAAFRYSAETRKRVLEAAAELGYKPNASARAIRNGRFGCAALVLSRSRQQTHSHIPPGLLDGLDDELARHDMHLTVSRLSDEELSSAEFLPKVLREAMADGMIVNYTHEIPRPMLDAIHAHHTPAVWLNAKLSEDCVYPDDFNASVLATRELITRGHRRIAFLHLVSPEVYPGKTFEEASPRMHYSVSDRLDGYLSAMSGAGLSPVVAHADRFIPEQEQFAACRAILRSDNRPTAFLVYAERDVSSLMCAAAELGLSVPKDLSILVYSPSEPWICGKRISIVQIPTTEMGCQAVQMLRKKMESPNEICAPVSVAYGPLPRETIAPLVG